ncbi:hypothetical protein ACFLXW_00355 [Candidatus Dependentiae bacterium]
MVKNLMVLTVDDRRRIATAFAVFVRIDARKKSAKKSNRKSKLNDDKKARSPTGLQAFSFPTSSFQIGSSTLSP